MSKPKLPVDKQLKELTNIQNIYALNNISYSIPHKLYHYFPQDATDISQELEKINNQGLQIHNPGPDTSFIDEKITRPRGNYFWGSKIKQESNLEIEIKQLNYKHLYAFPHQIADKILTWQDNYQIPNQFWANLDKLTTALPFSHYKGQFRAEFIYTLPIPPAQITINC